MAEYLNHYELKRFAPIVAACTGTALTEQYCEPVPWITRILLERLGGTADRAVLYHADAVGQYIWQKYTDLFAPVYAHTSLAVPFVSTVQSVTPVAHASMYTGLDPSGHGIETYVRPQLTCDTLFDRWIAQGKRVAILAQRDSTFLHIFSGRELDYYEEPNATRIGQKALELLREDRYDILSIHTFDYDDAAHAYGPESREALNAVALEAENFASIACLMEQLRGKHRTLLTYSPDHGQHLTEGGRGSHGSLMTEDMNILHMFGTV